MQIGSKQLAGQFSYYTDGSRSNPVSYIFAKDLDGDGSQEVLFVAFETQPNTPQNYSNTSVHIFGWKSNVFQDLTSQWLPNNTNLVEGVGDVAFGDFNGDGLSDIFLSAYTDMNHPVNAYQLINLGGTFKKVSLGSETWMHAVASADINGDGYDDVVSAGYSNFHQFLGSTSGLIPYRGMVGSSGLALGDFLGDGTITAIFIDAGSGSQDTFLYRFEVNQQNQIVGLQKIATLPGPRLAALGLETSTASSHDIRARPMDFNGDGLQDVVVFSYLADYSQSLSQNSHKSEIQFLLNLGNRQFKDVTDQYRVGYDTAGYVGYYPQVADINLDGRLDIFTSSPDWMPSYNSTTLLLQQQDGVFLDTDRALMRSNITANAYAQEIMVSGPNQARYLISESKWNWSDPITKIYIQAVTFPEREAAEALAGTSSSDWIYGLGGNDQIEGKKGNDVIDGGSGIDTATYSGLVSQYQTTAGAQAVVVDKTSNRDGTDTLTNVERLKFSDKNIALDTGKDQSAGAAYMLYRAALDRQPDDEGLGFWISVLDRNVNINDVAQAFMTNPEYIAKYGANNSNSDFVTNLYANVLHRPLDKPGFDFWVNGLDKGLTNRAAVLEAFASSPDNVNQVASLIANGIQYKEYVG